MFSKKMIISGFVSGVMLAVTSFSTPASADQNSFNLEIGIERLLNELIAPEKSAPKIHNFDSRGVPIRKIHRKMRRRGLYPVSEYRLRGDRVIIRAEDDYGTLFRVVADAYYGSLVRIRRVRESNTYRPALVVPPFYNDGYDNYRPGYDRPTRRNKPHYNSSRADRKAAKIAKARAIAKRKAAKAAKARAIAKRRTAKTAKARAIAKRRASKSAKPRSVNKRKRVNNATLTSAQRKARKAARVNNRGNRKAAKTKAAKNRKAAQLKAARNRKVAKLRADRNRRAKSRKLPYNGLTAKQYEMWKYGSGR